VLDKDATHKHPKVLALLARHPRWTFHFTPTAASWPNAVGNFFSKMTRQRIRRGVLRSGAHGSPRNAKGLGARLVVLLCFGMMPEQTRGRARFRAGPSRRSRSIISAQFDFHRPLRRSGAAISLSWAWLPEIAGGSRVSARLDQGGITCPMSEGLRAGLLRRT
jgi:hypothetical protein